MKDKKSLKQDKGLVPRLRFPEFRDAGPWEVKRLGDFLSESRIKGNKGDVAKKLTVKLWGKGVYAKNNDVRGSANTQYYRRSAGQIIYSKLDFLNQAFGIIPPELDGYESTIDLPCFDVNDEADTRFILEYIKREAFYKKVGDIADGSRKAKRIHQDIFLSFPVFFPSLPEQQKIADCLSSLDELIELEGKKLEALKAHKKGLMQQLFPREGETTPRLRFPEFRDAGPWEVSTFGRVATFINGRAYKQAELLSKGKYRVLRVGNFFSNDEWYYSNLELDEDKYCNDGDLLYAWSASFGPRIWHGEKVIYHYHIWKVIENDLLNRDFLFILLDYETEKMKAKSANGLGLLHITKSTIEDWKCHFPSPPEQQKIADCLSSLDELIELQNQKLEALKAQKKGLMQQLFPQEVS